MTSPVLLVTQGAFSAGLALAQPNQQPPSALGREEVDGARLRPGKGERILVVEDDFLLASQVEGALRDAGFDVIGIAASAEDALELAASEQPLLCVMDIRLAGARDGIDAAVDLFKAQGVRCIFATAHSDAQARKRAEAAAPLGWLQKPFSTASLLNMVRGAITELSSQG